MSEIKTYTIKPGITLHHIDTNQFKTVSVGLHFHRQLKKNEAALNALLTDVMQRGNSKLKDTAAISRYLQALYGAYFDADIRRKGEDQILSYVISTVSDEYLPEGEQCVLKAVSMLFDMVLCPQIENGAFRADYVEQEKVNLINDIEALINDKRSYAVWRLVENMCDGDPYSIYELGRVEDVKAITPKMLYDHYQTVLQESPVDIFVTGKADIDAIIETTKERFADISPDVLTYPKTTLYRPSNTMKQIEEVFDVTQAKLSMGFYTGIAPDDARYSALMVFNSIFGSGAHSKLFNNVREKLSLCYYASSRLERYKGIMLVSSGIESQNKQKAEDEILLQLDAIKNGDISDYEFDVSVKSIINSLRSMRDSNGYLADYYLGQVVSGTNISLEEQCRLISGVTKEDVVKVAQEIKPEMVYFMKGEA
ncbi:MAG: insulinase family protein [Ruminococcaceae bacterium]|nr:insulinase family protein [Oscillospiraceae bacterium]